MAEVGSAVFAVHLRAVHAVAEVLLGSHIVAAGHGVKAGPAAAGFELVVRGEEF